MISIYSFSPDPATVDRKVLSSFFRSERGENGATFLHRKRNVSPRGFIRLLFPQFLVKAKKPEGQGRLRYQLKPDGVATFMFFVLVAGSAISLFDPNSSEEYPSWMGLVFVGWYILRAVIEIIRTKAAFDRATSGEPLPRSETVDKVLAILEAQENEADNET